MCGVLGAQSCGAMRRNVALMPPSTEGSLGTASTVSSTRRASVCGGGAVRGV